MTHEEEYAEWRKTHAPKPRPKLRLWTVIYQWEDIGQVSARRVKATNAHEAMVKVAKSIGEGDRAFVLIVAAFCAGRTVVHCPGDEDGNGGISYASEMAALDIDGTIEAR